MSTQKEATTAFVDWARRNAVRLDRIEDKGGPADPVDDSDLAPLKAMVGDARIVALGESTHHTHEFLALRERLVRYLVERLGFTTIMLEVMHPGANPIDDYVAQGLGSAKAALVAANIRMWRNRESVRILEWARAHNLKAAPGQEVRFTGPDMIAPGEGMRLILDQIELDAGTKARLYELSSGFDTDPRDDQLFYNRRSDEERALLHATFDQVLATLRASGPRPGQSTADHLALLDQAIVVTQALDAARIGATDGWIAAWPARDVAMGANAIRMVEADPGRKVVIMASNRHVAAIQPAGDAVVPMGAFLREHFGDAYLVIGGSFGEGHFDPPLYGATTIPRNAQDTMDQRIADLESGPLLLDIRATAADPAPAYVRQPRPLQSSGLLDHTAAPAATYDIIVHLDRLTNAGQLIEEPMDLDYAVVDANRPALRAKTAP